MPASRGQRAVRVLCCNHRANTALIARRLRDEDASAEDPLGSCGHARKASTVVLHYGSAPTLDVCAGSALTRALLAALRAWRIQLISLLAEAGGYQLVVYGVCCCSRAASALA